MSELRDRLWRSWAENIYAEMKQELERGATIPPSPEHVFFEGYNACDLHVAEPLREEIRRLRAALLVIATLDWLKESCSEPVDQVALMLKVAGEALEKWKE